MATVVAMWLDGNDESENFFPTDFINFGKETNGRFRLGTKNSNKCLIKSSVIPKCKIATRTIAIKNDFIISGCRNIATTASADQKKARKGIEFKKDKKISILFEPRSLKYFTIFISNLSIRQ